MSAKYYIDYDDFASKFTPWFIREYGFEYSDGDFKTGNTNDQDIRFHIQARNGHFYQFIRIGVGIDRYLNADINKQELNKRIRQSLKEDSFNIDNIYIVTLGDIQQYNITDPSILSALEQDKYILAVEASINNNTDGIILSKDNTGSYVSFVQSLLLGLQYLNNLFYDYILDKKEELKFNGQIINLQRRLNDIFDDTLRRIYIVNVRSIPVQYVYRITEFQNDFVYRISEAQKDNYIVGRTSEIGASQYDFAVYLPVSLTYNTDRMNAVINRYKLVDKNYTIQTY